MKIAIVGYGRMGRRIRALALEEGLEVVAIIDAAAKGADCPEITAAEITEESLNGADAVIDFTVPGAAAENARKYAAIGVPAVIGTTGWHSEIPELEKEFGGKDFRILYSGNFSVGVAAFVKIAEYAAEVFNRLERYDVGVHETHHAGKADSPSGTAIMIGNALLKGLERKKELDAETQHGKIKKDVIQVSSLRVGSVPGTHTVLFDSPEDSIKLEHAARSRDGFASGALMAAKWIVNTKKRGFLSMDAFVDELLG